MEGRTREREKEEGEENGREGSWKQDKEKAGGEGHIHSIVMIVSASSPHGKLVLIWPNHLLISNT